MATKVNGKNKGNSFERKIANALSKRFEEFTGKPKSFIRNSDSGSFFGGSNVARTETHNTEFAVYGDLVCPRAFNFSVECKHYKSAPGFQSIISHHVAQWDAWLIQATQDAKAAGKAMSLVVKYNNVEEIVFLESKIPSAAFYSKYKQYYVYRFEDVLACADNFFFS